MHTKFERLLSKSLTTLEVTTYYLVVHTGPGWAMSDVSEQSWQGTAAGCGQGLVCWYRHRATDRDRETQRACWLATLPVYR